MRDAAHRGRSLRNHGTETSCGVPEMVRANRALTGGGRDDSGCVRPGLHPEAHQGGVVLLAEPLKFSHQVIGGFTNLGSPPDPPLSEPRKVPPRLPAPNDRIQEVVLACQKTRCAGWALGDVRKACTGSRPVVDEAQSQIGIFGRIGQLEPVPSPFHPLPNHRKYFLKRGPQRIVAGIAGVNKDPKRLRGTPGRLVLPTGRLVAQRRHEKRKREGPGAGRTVADQPGVSPRSRLAFAWAFTRLRAP